MTITPEAKDKVKEMLQMLYAFVLHQMPEILTDGKESQAFDLEFEAPADMLYKECKLRTVDTAKMRLVFTFYAPERKLLLPPGIARPRPVPDPPPQPVDPPKPEEPDPED